eukprot:scaffold27984_cov113-Isochrysis_galbana.AAC.1
MPLYPSTSPKSPLTLNRSTPRSCAIPLMLNIFTSCAIRDHLSASPKVRPVVRRQPLDAPRQGGSKVRGQQPQGQVGHPARHPLAPDIGAGRRKPCRCPNAELLQHVKRGDSGLRRGQVSRLEGLLGILPHVRQLRAQNAHRTQQRRQQQLAHCQKRRELTGARGLVQQAMIHDFRVAGHGSRVAQGPPNGSACARRGTSARCRPLEHLAKV